MRVCPRESQALTLLGPAQGDILAQLLKVQVVADITLGQSGVARQRSHIVVPLFQLGALGLPVHNLCNRHGRAILSGDRCDT